MILADRANWPNLASLALALVCQQLSPDWQQTHGHPIAAVECFVNSQLFRGTADNASNWTRPGKTDGCKRVAEDSPVSAVARFGLKTRSCPSRLLPHEGQQANAGSFFQ